MVDKVIFLQQFPVSEPSTALRGKKKKSPQTREGSINNRDSCPRVLSLVRWVDKYSFLIQLIVPAVQKYFLELLMKETAEGNCRSCCWFLLSNKPNPLKR